MAHTTERAILVLCAHPNLVTAVQATTADVDESNENSEVLQSARDILDRFPAEVQHAATMRRVVIPRRLAIMASVKAAQRKKYGEGGQAEPVLPLLEALADAPGDLLRVIVGFVGEGEALEESSSRRTNEEPEGEGNSAGGRKREREE